MAADLLLHIQLLPQEGKEWMTGEHKRLLMEDLDALLDITCDVPVYLELPLGLGKVLSAPREWVTRQYASQAWGVDVGLNVSQKNLARCMQAGIEQALTQRQEAGQSTQVQPPAPWWRRALGLKEAPVPLPASDVLARRCAEGMAPILRQVVGNHTALQMQMRSLSGELFSLTRNAGYPAPEFSVATETQAATPVSAAPRL